MRKFLSLFLAVVLAAGALLAAPIQLPGLVVSASAEVEPETPTGPDYDAESFLTYTLSPDGKEYYVSGYTGEVVDELVIPAEYQGKPVTKIGDNAFSSNLNIKNVKLPDTIVEIGYECFTSSSIENIIIPDSVTYIAPYAFEFCYKLKKVVLSKNVNVIESQTFDSCTELTEVIIPDGKLECISYHAFNGCTKLEKINIPDSVRKIESNAFTNTKIVNDKSFWENGALYIGNHLMATDDTIGEMYRVKQGTVHISYSAFANRANLGSIFIPKTVKAISDNAFLNCSALAFLFYESTVDDFNKINFNNNEYSLENTVVILEAAGAGIPAKPTVNSVTNVANGVQITWNAVDNADVYIVWRRGAGTSDWTMLGITDQTSVIDTSAGHRQYWRYSVQAMNADGFSDFDYTGKYLKYVATPKLTGVSNATNGIYFKWNAVSGASGYRVYRRGAGGNWQYITTVKGTGYTDTAVKNQSGKYYRYTVRAVVDGRYSGYEDFLYTKRLANPKLTSATSDNAGITVKWSAISGTTGYYVYRKTANSGWKHVGTCYGTKTTSFLDKTAAKGTTYTYTVRAVYGKTTSYFDSGIKCKR